jgi:hypothetical protein
MRLFPLSPLSLQGYSHSQMLDVILSINTGKPRAARGGKGLCVRACGLDKGYVTCEKLRIGSMEGSVLPGLYGSPASHQVPHLYGTWTGVASRSRGCA